LNPSWFSLTYFRMTSSSWNAFTATSSRPFSFSSSQMKGHHGHNSARKEAISRRTDRRTGLDGAASLRDRWASLERRSPI